MNPIVKKQMEVLNDLHATLAHFQQHGFLGDQLDVKEIERILLKRIAAIDYEIKHSRPFLACNQTAA